jgi:hypothetical protein
MRAEALGLPPAAALTRAEAGDVAHWIRTDLRPSLLERMRASYAGGETGAAEAAGLEAALEAVELYAYSLDPIVRGGLPATPAEEMAPRFTALSLSPPAHAACRAVLFCCAQSKFFVHGPILLRYAVELAGRLLLPGETIVSAGRATFRRPVQNNAVLMVRDASTADAGAVALRAAVNGDEGEAAAEGELHTSEGRSLRYVFRPIAGDPILNESGFNTPTLRLLRRGGVPRAQGRQWTFPLCVPSMGEADGDAAWVRHFDASPSAAAMTILDVLTAALVTARRAPGRTILVAGVENLPVPATAGRALAGHATLELSLPDEPLRLTPSGTALVPMDYRFSFAGVTWSRALLAEYPGPACRLFARA